MAPHVPFSFMSVAFLIPFPPVSTSSYPSSWHRIFLILGPSSKITLTAVAEFSVPLTWIVSYRALLSCFRKPVRISNGGRVLLSASGEDCFPSYGTQGHVSVLEERTIDG